MRWQILIVLTSVNLLNYIDRYIFSALLPVIKTDLSLSDTQLGLLGSAFVYAYVVMAPIFGYLGDKNNRPRLMSVGVAFWSVATAFSGWTRTFTGQFLTRFFVGVGESAYTVIAPSTLADLFAKESRGKVFAIFSGAIPVGSALGYVMGGLLEPRFGWQRSFFIVGVPGLFLAALLFFMKETVRGAQDHVMGKPSSGAKAAYSHLFKNRIFLIVVMGYAAYTFAIGGMAFWMPSYLVRSFAVSLEKANVIFGGVTVFGGMIGTLLGGWVADRWERKWGRGYLKVCCLSMIVAIPLFVLALQFADFSIFMVALFFMEVALFMCISPLDVAVLNCVPVGYRATAMALNVFLIHFFGDGISRFLMGAVSDASNLKESMMILPLVLGLATVLWAWALTLQPKK